MDRSQSLFQASLFQVKFNFSEILNEKFRIFISPIWNNIRKFQPNFTSFFYRSNLFRYFFSTRRFNQLGNFNQLGITFSFLAFSEASENSGIVPRNFSSFSNFPGIRVTGIWLSVAGSGKRGSVEFENDSISRYCI